MTTLLMDITLILCPACGCPMIPFMAVYTVQRGLTDITFTCPNCETKGAVDVRELGAGTVIQPPQLCKN